MVTTYTGNNYTTINWTEIAKQYKAYLGDAHYYEGVDWTKPVAEPQKPPMKVKPKRMEFNIKAKGWKPPAKRNRMTEDQALSYLESKGYFMGQPFKAGGLSYVVDKDEEGYYWMEV